MTTIEEADLAIAQKFVAMWTGLGYSAGSVGVPNRNFVAPDAGPWVRLSFVTLLSRQRTMGDAGSVRFKRSRMMTAQVFIDQNIGQALESTLAQAILDDFEQASISGTTVEVKEVNPQPIGSDGRWSQSNVDITYDFEQTK